MRGGVTLRGLLLSCATGGLLWTAMPGGGGLWSLLFVALVPLLVVVQRAGGRGALLFGFIAGFVHFLSLLYWIVIVLGRYGGLPLPVSIGALLLLACYMALYVMFFSWSAGILFRKSSPLLALWGLPLLWVGLDWLRSVAFTGLPWMDLGYGLAGVPLLIQCADFVGHHGLTFLIVLINVLMAQLLFSRTAEPVKNHMKTLVVPVIVLLMVVSGYSWLRWQQLGEQLATSTDTIKIGVVQGNIDQAQKWSFALQRKTVVNYVDQGMRQVQQEQPALLVWPETAMPFYPIAHPLLEPLQTMVQQGEVALLTGAPWYKVLDPDKRQLHFYNSALLFAPDGTISGSYFKSHLVPFGEYVPLRKFLPFLEPLVESVGDFTPGTITAPLQSGQLRVGVLICFESIFPALARKWVDAGANVLVNLTNDAWYGKSSAPYHSWAMTIFRAVETRRSVVRAANTGISGFIDPLGRVEQRSGLFEQWSASGDVILRDEETVAVRYGYLVGPLCLLLGCLGIFQARRSGRSPA